MSSCVWDGFAGKLVDHLSNSVIYQLVCVVGGWDYEDEVSGILPARAFSRDFALILATILFAGGRVCTVGFSSIIAITLLGWCLRFGGSSAVGTGMAISYPR